MPEIILSDYFYGDESEEFIYFKIPRLLITDQKFKHVSTDAKLLYGMLLDRMGLSAKNNWYDDYGRVYIYYTVDEICEDMCCGRDKAMKLLAELDKKKGIGLVERVKQGQGRPTKLYVKRFTTRTVPKNPAPPPPESFTPCSEVDFLDPQTSEKSTSRRRKNPPQDVGKTDPNQTKRNHPDLSHPDLSIPPQTPPSVFMGILEQQMGVGRLSGSHKSIIDRCTANVYQDYFNNRGRAPMPLLTDWRNEVMRQADPEAREIALAAELITEGSLNVFAHPGNVNMDSRIVVLDLYEMGEQLRPTALVVTLEAIQNRVMENRKRGKYTWVFLDEVYLYFKYHYSGEFLYRAWKRFRKYAGIMTAATQNVEECLKSETARLMLANSEFLLLFNQAATDRVELAKLLHISDTQMGYITNAEAGHGLLRIGGSLVPFSNTIPRDTELYRLMSTTPGEN